MLYERDYHLGLTETEEQQYEEITGRKFWEKRVSGFGRVNNFMAYPKAARMCKSLFPNNYLDVAELRDVERLEHANEEFLSSSRLDDLQCAFASLKGFLKGEKKAHLAVHCVLDNEEVGSGTKQGAASTFLYDVLVRINECMGYSYENYVRNLAKSFMLSADNAHAVHPNYSDVADPVNRPYLNEGIVIKYSANQKYCTDAVSAAMFKDICKKADVPYQVFTNRSDILGGSTLGNISTTKVALNAVDIGLPQLAMHSPYETAGIKDTWYLIQAAGKFFA